MCEILVTRRFSRRGEGNARYKQAQAFGKELKLSADGFAGQSDQKIICTSSQKRDEIAIDLTDEPTTTAVENNGISMQETCVKGDRALPKVVPISEATFSEREESRVAVRQRSDSGWEDGYDGGFDNVTEQTDGHVPRCMTWARILHQN